MYFRFHSLIYFSDPCFFTKTEKLKIGIFPIKVQIGRHQLQHTAVDLTYRKINKEKGTSKVLTKKKLTKS